MLFRCRYRVAVLCGSLSLALGYAADAAAGAAPQASPARPKIAVRTRAPSSAAATYTTHDIGVPPAGTYASSMPVGFNNSGQIFGEALRLAKSDRLSYASDTSCLAWTGTRFVDLEPSLVVQACVPYAMNSAGANGAFTVVGTVTDIYHAPLQLGPNIPSGGAFSSVIGAVGSPANEAYHDHSPAALYGVNAAGTAVGYSYNPNLRDRAARGIDMAAAELRDRANALSSTVSSNANYWGTLDPIAPTSAKARRRNQKVRE